MDNTSHNFHHMLHENAARNHMTRGILNAMNKREQQIMAKSQDRVRFQLQAYYFTCPGIRGLLRSSFQLDGMAGNELAHKADTYGHVVIVCRPSQFARFLIYREKEGMQNMFKELKAELFTPAIPAATNEPVDVSANFAPNLR